MYARKPTANRGRHARPATSPSIRRLTIGAFAAIGCTLMLSAAFLGCDASPQDKSVERVQDNSRITPPTPSKRVDTSRKADAMPEAKPPEILPETHMAAGHFHESQGHLARAVEQYRQAIALMPRHIEAYNRLGIVLDQLGRFREADDAFQHAIRIAPDQAYLRNNLAFSFIMQARWKDAENALNESLEVKPDFVRARVNLGMVLAQQDRFEEAVAQFERALPKSDAHYNIGLMYQSKRKLAEAARSFKTALEHNPKLAAAQKRLDMLPPDVVKAAVTNTAATASPVARAAQIPAAEQTVRPATQPAAAPTAQSSNTVKPAIEATSTAAQPVAPKSPEPAPTAPAAPALATHIPAEPAPAAPVAPVVPARPANPAPATPALAEAAPTAPAVSEIAAPSPAITEVIPSTPVVTNAIPSTLCPEPTEALNSLAETTTVTLSNPFELPSTDFVTLFSDLLLQEAANRPLPTIEQTNTTLGYETPVSILTDPEFAAAIESAASPREADTLRPSQDEDVTVPTESPTPD